MLMCFALAKIFLLYLKINKKSVDLLTPPFFIIYFIPVVKHLLQKDFIDDCS